MSVGAREVIFLVGDGVDALDLAGPMDAFTHANLVGGAQHYATRVVGAAAGLTLLGGLRVTPDDTLETGRPTPELHTTVIAIGHPPDRGAPVDGRPSDNARLAAWLRQHPVDRVASVCVGAFALAEAGVLDGRRATTHWLFTDTLRRCYPAVEVVPDAIYVRDDPVWTSAGVSAGIDLALALVEQDLGHQLALAVAQRLVLFLRRPGGQSQFSGALSLTDTTLPALRDLVAWIPGHLAEDLSVPALAARVGMSRRTFTRRFTRELGESPGHWVESARLNAARHLLESTTLGLQEVADACGFEQAGNLRRVFLRRLGVSGLDYRRRFGAR